MFSEFLNLLNFENSNFYSFLPYLYLNFVRMNVDNNFLFILRVSTVPNAVETYACVRAIQMFG